MALTNEATSKACPLCTAEMQSSFSTDEAAYFLCGACGYLKPFVHELDEHALNVAIYQERFDENLHVATKITKGGRRRYRRILDRSERHREHGRFLDIGCGAGRLLVCAAERGWQAIGCDPSMKNAAQLERERFQILPKTLDECAFPDAHFDVVHANEVVEHITDVHSLLLESARVLRPGGLLILRTPSYESWTTRCVGTAWRGYGVFENGHVGFFAKRSFPPLFAQHGLELVDIRTHHFSIRDRYPVRVPVLGTFLRFLYRVVGYAAGLTGNGERMTIYARRLSE